MTTRTLPETCTDTTHGRRQHVEDRPDGSRVQVCDRCGRAVAVVQKPQRKAA